jgi:hypothetical protein
MSITTSLHRAAQLQEKIDELRGQLAELLDRARSEIASAPAVEAPVVKRRGRKPGRKPGPKKGRRAAVAVAAPVVEDKVVAAPKKLDGRSKEARALKLKQKAAPRSPLAGHKRSASPSGPLAPAVVKVLSSKGSSMNVRDILDDLLASGYKFNTPEPKKNLAARIYRLKGVKQVGEGLFAAA